MFNTNVPRIHCIYPSLSASQEEPGWKEGGWKQQCHGGGYVPGPRDKRQGSMSVDEQDEATGETWQSGGPWDLDLGTV